MRIVKFFLWNFVFTAPLTPLELPLRFCENPSRSAPDLLVKPPSEVPLLFWENPVQN